MIEISVVIPTCNRKERLISLLHNLMQSTFPLKEVIIVDSGEDRLSEMECSSFQNPAITYISSEKSVCIQRNKGIAIAKSAWIFLCDDDIEVPADYVEKIIVHITKHSEAVAVSGLVLQQNKNKWVAKYPVTSTKELLWKYIFKLGIWGEINCKDNFISTRLKRYFKNKGNYISKAGWPVITNFSGDYFTVPVYGLGASLIKKEWLQRFPYDEVLDSHGIGDNYGLSINFPKDSIHILNNALVYHHQETTNRLQRPLQYYRRAMALDYFRRTNKNIAFVKKVWLLWSLKGNLFGFIVGGDVVMIKISLKLIYSIAFGKNQYYDSYTVQHK